MACPHCGSGAPSHGPRLANVLRAFGKEPRTLAEVAAALGCTMAVVRAALGAARAKGLKVRTMRQPSKFLIEP